MKTTLQGLLYGGNMKYKIIVDSCCELPEEYASDPHFCSIPFGLEVGEHNLVDDKELDVANLLRLIAECPTCPKSSCPSPQLFMENMAGEEERIYIITISSNLSGSYNSAIVAKKMFEEQHPGKKIAVIDSLSASGGETQIALLAKELEEAGESFEEIEARLNQYRDEMETSFVLDNVETLRKNGRLSRVKALLVTSLNIKPILAAENGTIIQVGQAIGLKKAMSKLVDTIIKNGGELSKKRIVITHCNNLKSAQEVKKMLQEKVNAQNIVILATRGLSTLYANDGGVIVTY